MSGGPSSWNPFKQPKDDPNDAWQDYLATNLMDALEQVQDTGDWYGATMTWCKENSSGRIKPNRTMNDGSDNQGKA